MKPVTLVKSLGHVTVSLFAVLILAACSEPVQENLQTIPSPDGRYAATAFRMNLSATIPYCPEVFLGEAGERVGRRGNIFQGYKDERIRVFWRSPTNLVIYCTPDCRIDQAVARWKDVEIEIVKSWSWLEEAAAPVRKSPVLH